MIGRFLLRGIGRYMLDSDLAAAAVLLCIENDKDYEAAETNPSDTPNLDP